MKEFFHVCFSSRDEVMFRSEGDYLRGMDCLRGALLRSGTVLLADALMSNHVHLAVLSEDLGEFVNSFRIGYGKYFNRRYLRSGRLGEKGYFGLKVDGLYHRLTALSYVLRNPLHHRVCGTPFGYRFSSAR